MKDVNRDSALYQWAQVFKADTWEEIRMLAQKNEAINECVYTMAKLSEDDRIRMQCEARADSEAIEKGLYNRGRKEGLQEGLKEGRREGLREGAEQLLVQLITARLKDGADIPAIAADLVQKEEYIEELIGKYQLGR